jgi:UBX domain-containing protein 1
MRRDNSDSEKEEGQAYYAGGSEHGGGQQILGPSKKKKDVNSLVSEMFRSAREHGAEEMEEDESPGRRGTAASKPVFHGRAYRLGDESTASEMVQGSSTSASSMPDRPEVKMVLKLWKNGFSVDDGPVRDFSDPGNRAFLTDIQNGRIPAELVQQAHGGQVSLNMEDHRDEDYVRPAAVVQPFSGEGHRLGCPSDPVTMANMSARDMAGPPVNCESEAAAELKIDQSQPTTSLQIRLADGSRLIAKFNHSHRISDVRQYVITARPDYASTPFVLMTTFPSAELTDEKQTLADAKLLNAVLVQRLK